MNKRMRKGLFLSSGVALLTSGLGILPNVAASQSSSLETKIVTDMARYTLGQPVNLQVSITNPTNATVTGAVYVSVDHLSQTITKLSPLSVSIPAQQSQEVTLTWTPPNTDYQGYLVHGDVVSDTGSSLSTFQTAVDVSSDWTKFPRYGYVSDYPQMSMAQATSELEELNAYHIDGLQFYDWQWKHDVPLAGTVKDPASSWQDIALRTNYRQTILDLINEGHSLGMKSFNYNLLYGAWDGSKKDGVNPAWGLYSDNGGSLPVDVTMPNGWATNAIDVFNPANSVWRNYILNQEANVFKAYPFDGWQVDQLGDLGTVYDVKGNIVNLENTFTPFLNDAVKTLHRQVIFNDVGAYGLPEVAANSNESVAYVECWLQNGQAIFNDLKYTVDQVNTLSKGKKAAVLAAYMDSNYANSFSDQNPGIFDTPGVLLTDATIFASGGDHIELGDNLQMLNAPYFPNHNLVMDNSLKTQLLSYYNFMVAYENLLRGNLRNTSNAITLKGLHTSTDSQSQTVWEFSKAGGDYQVLQLINLYGQNTPLWQDANATARKPKLLQGIQVKYYIGNRHVSSVSLASPDFQSEVSENISFSNGHDKKGNYIQFTIPSLQYWDMVYMKTAK